MLKIRVIPTLLWNGNALVKGKGFDSWRTVGSALQAVKVFNLRGVDELVLLDIRATAEGRAPDFSMVDELADWCFVPLSVGGGVSSAQDVAKLLRAGADKVVITTAATKSDVIPSVVRKFGSQCVVAGIDVRRHQNGACEVFTHSGATATGRDPVDYARELERLGAGEILLASIERDGMMCGYDVALTRAVSDAVSVPVIASGGAGCYQDMADVLREGGASAVAAASIFQFTEQTPREAKQFLKEKGFAVRL